MARLLTKTGIVKAVEGHTALVLTELEPECESCKAKDACSSMGGTGANVEVRARNTAGAQVGDVVQIGLRSSAFLKATFMIYKVPILSLTGGIILGHVLADFVPLGRNLLVGGLAGIALVASFVWLKMRGDELSGKKEFVPEIVSKKVPGSMSSHGGGSCPSSDRKPPAAVSPS